MYSYIPFDLNQLLDIGVHQWLQICVVDICQAHGSFHLETHGMVGGRLMPPLPFGLETYKSRMFGQIHAGHDVQDCQNRHRFSGSNAWIALSNVPLKELHWPLCTGWTLGWCRTLPMPVSVQSYGCCPVVIDRCSTLCHTQRNCSPAWSEQWPGTASEVCLCLLPTSNEQPPGWVWEPPYTVSLEHWCVSWMRGVSPTTAQGTSLTPPLAESPRSGCSEMYDFVFVGCKLETIPCRRFLYCIHCLL